MAKKKRRSQKAKLIDSIKILSLILIVLVVYAVIDGVTVSHKGKLRIEAGEGLPSVTDFFPATERAEAAKAKLLTDISAVDTNTPGVYEVQLQVGNKTYDAKLVVEDTVDPKATTKDLSVFDLNTVKPEDFIDTITDVTAVTVTFKKPLDENAEEQTVELLLTDLGGNETTVTAKMTKSKDPTPPVINGVPRILEAYEGGTIAYRNGVTVTDEEDPNPQLQIDTSKVNLAVPGTYTVVYIATDKGGNTTRVETTVRVYEKAAGYVEPEVIYAMADKLLATFITDGMTDLEKVEAVYKWVMRNNQYGGNTDKSDWLQGAYTQMTTRKGDCFGYFALNKLFLQRMGIPTIDVERVKVKPSENTHFWLLVSVDGGKSYYHMDNVWSQVLCLVTDERLDNFNTNPAVRNAFNRDKSLYPATPSEPLPANSIRINEIRNYG
ncbi:MAG: transglutaminase domain-containing protein [Oscillospiraceae bacterium]|nr:transglutaminase domain-containing protein [Oscillospiraceae bacterium]